MDEQSQPAASVWPISFALGLALVLVGLIVSPLVIAPVGAAIAVLAGFLWVRGAAAGPGVSVRPRRLRSLSRRVTPSASRAAVCSSARRSGSAVSWRSGSVYPRPASRCCRRSSASGGRPSTSGRSDAFPLGQYVVATFLADPEAG